MSCRRVRRGWRIRNQYRDFEKSIMEQGMKTISLSEGTEQFREIKKEWQQKARECTIESLPGFIKELTEKYSHDYGTICHAVAMAAVAAAWAVEHSPTGGITGFQAGAVMWEFIREWNCSDNKTGMRLIDYDNFLYPQYADKYQKTISKDIWEAIQKEARLKIEEADQNYEEYKRNMQKYKTDIAAFVMKYPDYYERKEHYDPLGMGTGDQWKKEEKKKASGFELAPQEPYRPTCSGDDVYLHWLAISNGKVPFGYIIEC